MDSNSQIHRAIIWGRRGRKKAAAKLLRDVLAFEPGNERAWWLLAGVVDNTAEMKSCLEKVLALNPQNEKARAQLNEIKNGGHRKHASKRSVLLLGFIILLFLAGSAFLALQFGDEIFNVKFPVIKDAVDTPIPTILTPSVTRTSTPQSTPTSTKTPGPTTMPSPTAAEEYLIEGISGQPMRISLDCESNSAVIFARHYGIEIDEVTFFLNLPVSDNPHKGFVGNVHDEWGNIPPAGYGVYPAPVVIQLKKYGVAAKDVYDYTLEELQKQIADGNPVIAWVIGRVERGRASEYTSSDGETSLVARYQHTVIVIGYDHEKLTILDGDQIYQRSYDDFLTSWAVLGNMAIIKSEQGE